MKEKIFNLIKSYDSIVIARHKSPDFDAYGSQFGLYYALKEKYPEKRIYVVGDTNPLNVFQEMDVISENIYKESLLIILDTVAKQMLEEGIYENYDKLILIDHHRNSPDIDYDLYYQDISASSCAEIVYDMLTEWNIEINFKSAKALYYGILGDTGRFLHSNTTAKTLEIASKLLAKGLDLQEIHSNLYLEPRKNKVIKHEFFKRVKYTKKNIGYCITKERFLRKYDLTSSYVSRGMVNQMSGMNEVPIWANFTYDTKTQKILCELRSRKHPVVEVAKKYGGGGHLNASGCYLDSWSKIKPVLKDLDDLVVEKDEI